MYVNVPHHIKVPVLVSAVLRCMSHAMFWYVSSCVMEFVFWEMTWRIEVSITGSFGETRLLKRFLEAKCDQAIRCGSKFLGVISQAFRLQFRNKILRNLSDGYRGFPHSLEEKDC
jgi:hypothetical protein